MPALNTAVALVREVNPGRLYREAETPCAVLVAGASGPREELARLLSAGAPEGGEHPWLVRASLEPSALPGGEERAVALLAVQGNVPDAAERDAARRLRQAGLPALAVAFSAGPPPERHAPGTGRGTPPPAAPLAVPLAVPLVVLPPDGGAQAFATRVAPALVGRAGMDAAVALALARQFPVLRDAYARRLVEDTARANALYALSTGVAQVAAVLNVPIALADIAVLSKNQLIMAYKIALAAGRRDAPRVLMGEVVGVIGAGLLFRQIARGLVGLVPAFGMAPKVAVAYAGTRVIGQVVMAWALEGRQVRADELRALYGAALAAGERAAALLTRLPGR